MTELAALISRGDAGAARRGEELLRNAGMTAETEALRKSLVTYYTLAEEHRRDSGASHLDRDYEAALGHIKVLATAFPQNPEYAFWHASLLVDTGRYGDALPLLEALRAASAGRPFEINVLTTLARAHYARGDLAGAFATCETLLERVLPIFGAAPDAAQKAFLGSLLARMTRLLVNRGEPERAVELGARFRDLAQDKFLERTLVRAERLIDGGRPATRNGRTVVDCDALSVVCVKHGTKYPADYVNRLYNMVRRHLPGNWRFICLTDDASGLDEPIQAIDISGVKANGWWAKLALFNPDVAIPDDAVLYFDLDTVIVGSLDFVAGMPLGFHILEHPGEPCFNSSVMLFSREFARPVHDRFDPTVMDRLVSDQDWIEECMPTIDTFPTGLIRLYRGLHPDLGSTGLAETGTRVVTFPTVPKPHQIGRGWVLHHWR